ncbi:MAG: hypothetical protein WCA14_17475 [Steroidobacteraceae bacterium]
MMRLNRRRLVFGLYLIVLVAIAELVSGYLKVPIWPAFVALVLFFIEHMNVKRVPAILIGALVGIAMILAAPSTIALFARALGPQWGQLAYILLAVYLIVALGEMLPLMFNSFAFMYLTIAGLALATPNPNPYLWAVMAAVGGALLIAGAVLIEKMVGLHAPQAELNLAR